jgi:hypothetical protein
MHWIRKISLKRIAGAILLAVCVGNRYAVVPSS